MPPSSLPLVDATRLRPWMEAADHDETAPNGATGLVTVIAARFVDATPLRPRMDAADHDETAPDSATGSSDYRVRVQLSDSEVAIAAAEAGAAVVREKYGTPLARFDKSPTDFATAADLEAEAAILEVLRAARPGDAVIGEETGYGGPERAPRTWLVDPLCGTLNFAAQTPLAAVNVALRDGDTVSTAAAADPFAGEIFWTDGSRARVRHAGNDEDLRPSGSSRIVDVNLDGPFPNAATFRTVRLLADPDFAARFAPRVLSTTLALTWLAAGRRAAYITDGDLRDSVHFASGIALCQAAGCAVTNLAGDDLHTGVGGMVAAADQETHDALISLISRQRLT